MVREEKVVRFLSWRIPVIYWRNIWSLQGHSGYALQDAPVFYNQYKTKLTRRGVSYIISKYVVMAKKNTRLPYWTVITPPCVSPQPCSSYVTKQDKSCVYPRFLGPHLNNKHRIYAKADSEMSESSWKRLSWFETGELPSWTKMEI